MYLINTDFPDAALPLIQYNPWPVYEITPFFLLDFSILTPATFKRITFEDLLECLEMCFLILVVTIDYCGEIQSLRNRNFT